MGDENYEELTDEERERFVKDYRQHLIDSFKNFRWDMSTDYDEPEYQIRREQNGKYKIVFCKSHERAVGNKVLARGLSMKEAKALSKILEGDE